MNVWIKRILIFAAGATVGAGGMYLALDRKYAKLLAQETDDIRSYYRNRIIKLQDILEKKETDEADLSEGDPKSSPSITPEEYAKIAVVDSDGDKSFVDYTAFSRHEDISKINGMKKESAKDIRDELDKVSKAVHDDDFDKHMAEREHPEEDDNEYEEMIAEIDNQQIRDEQQRAKNENILPYAIMRSEYLNQKTWYEKLSWNFYEDGIVTDEHDDMVHAPAKILGTDFLEAFGMDDSDPDIAYIRNDQLAQDYEVCRIAERYYKTASDDNLKLSSEE